MISCKKQKISLRKHSKNFSRRKGFSFEREVVSLFRAEGFSSTRMWGSDGRTRGLPEAVDVLVEKEGVKFRIQCKRKAKLPPLLDLTNVDLVVLRENGGECLVLLPLRMMFRILERKEPDARIE